MPRATAVSSKTRPGLRSPSPLFCTPPSLSLSRERARARTSTRVSTLYETPRGEGGTHTVYQEAEGNRRETEKGIEKKRASRLSRAGKSSCSTSSLLPFPLPSPTLPPSISRLSLLSHSIHRIVPSVVQVGAYARQPSIPVPLQSSNHNPRHPGRERGR